MSKPIGQYDSFVPNMAVPDTFIAPDSTASRPNPGSREDRPRTPNQIPSTAIESNINTYQPERTKWSDK